MPLLGTSLVVMLSVLAVGLLTATAVFWNRLPGRGVPRWVARTGLLISGQVATIALVLAVANNYGYFYTSWAQIVGSGSQGAPRIDTAVPGELTAAGADVRSVRHLRAPSFSTPENYARQGQLQMLAITGARSRIRQDAYVYLPPQYFQAADAHLPAPPVAILGTSSHGEGGRAGWTDLEHFAALTRAPMTVQKVVPATGGHNFATWRREMSPSISWLPHQLQLTA